MARRWPLTLMLFWQYRTPIQATNLNALHCVFINRAGIHLTTATTNATAAYCSLAARPHADPHALLCLSFHACQQPLQVQAHPERHKLHSLQQALPCLLVLLLPLHVELL